MFDINTLLIDCGYNRNEVFVKCKRSLLLNQLLNQRLYNRDANAFINNISHRTIISRNYTFFRERKLPILRSRLNRLINQVLH